MRQEPLVSIIVNNYNYGRFLRAAIDSALNQRYGATEVIVVDDGSTDSSREIVLSYGDRITAVLKENGGQASAFNAGFARSRGAIVIFLDSDDMLLPGIAGRVAQAFCASPDSAKLQYRMEVIDALGRPTGTLKPADHLPLRSGDLRRHVLTFPFDMPWMATSGNAFAAQVLRRIFPIPEQVYGRVGADWYVSHLAPLFGPVLYLDDVGAYYRVHGSNSYELSAATINLAHIRQTITYAQHTLAYIKKFADQLGLEHRPDEADDVLSVSLVAERIVSLKLDPLRHPIKEDRTWKLLFLGAIASFRRFDVSLPAKLVFLLWFMAVASAPKSITCWLAEQFFFPATRGRFTRIMQNAKCKMQNAKRNA